MKRLFNSALVLGMGTSGEAAARLLLEQGTRVTIADRAATEAVQQRAESLRLAGAIVMTGVSEVPTLYADICIASPGLPVDSGWVAATAAAGLPVISELELAYLHCRCRVLAITGTNGKSTLTRLCGDALAVAGRRVAVGGNYGPPACANLAGDPDLDWVVWEVSSFQLETCQTFRPDVGVLINIQPDHLTRHGSLARYAQLKVSLFGQMSARDPAIIPQAQRSWIEAGLTNPVDLRTFGHDPASDYIYSAGTLTHAGRSIDMAGSPLDNAITGQTAAAAWAAADACGIPDAALSEALQAFQTLPHRMQQLSVIKGVTYVDDSKATNLAALKAGVQMAGGPVRLIAGGRLKEADLESAKELLANRVETVYLVGECMGLMEKAWKDVVSCRCCGTMERAVKAAAEDASEGEWVLLSPGCASFDQYPNYEVRGDHFETVVRQLER